MMRASRLFTLALVSICVLLAAISARADVRLPKVIGDHMVLQSGAAGPISAGDECQSERLACPCGIPHRCT